MPETPNILRRPDVVLPPEDPVTEVQRRQQARGRRASAWFWTVAAAFVLGSTMLAFLLWMAVQMLWYYGGRSLPDIQAHFRHGSIGAELANGMPYRMLRVLPKVFPEYFGKSRDWSHFGLILEGEKDDQGRPRYDIYASPRPKRDQSGKLEHGPAKLVPAEGEARMSRGLPIGFATGWRYGVEVAWFNCAVCHTGVVEMPGDARPRIVPGMPANTVNLERLFLALFSMAVDKRFTFENFEAAFKTHLAPDEQLWPHERLLWQWVVVPNTRATLIARRSELLPLLDPERAPPMAMDPEEPSKPALCEPRLQSRAGCSETINVGYGKPYRRERPRDGTTTSWGPGRVDTFNPYKLINFNIEADCLTSSERTGVSDFPSIFLQGPRAERVMHLHWDGNNASIAERNLSAAIGAGVSESTVDHASLARIVEWLNTLAPPPSPYRPLPAAVARGREIYMRECASCHGYQDGESYVFKGDRLGQIEPLANINTDPGRLHSYTPLMEKYQKDRLFCTTPEHRFRQFKKTDGYANMPLDGLWLRAPYLHNGSVPTLWDLLQPEDQRPVAFLKGGSNIRLDPEKGGFEAPSCLPAVEQRDEASFCFNTDIKGNGNKGHRYGTDLPEADKRNLLAYLLTF